MIIIPAIDLRLGKCVRLVEGDRDRATTYDASPVAAAEEFAAGGADWIHVVDLDGAFGGGESPNRRIVREIAAASPVPIQFGGGLRTTADVGEMLASGVARVVIGTVAVESPATLAEMIREFGPRVCVAIDARDGQVMIRGWDNAGAVPALELAQRVAAAGVERIVYTDISRDGTLTGLNYQQTAAVARAAGVAVTASGGVASGEDIRRLISIGEPLVDSVIIGKALYENRITLAEALKTAREA